MKRALFVVAVVAGSVWTGPTGRAFAATFTVDSTVDAVDVAPGDGLCADATGHCSLRAAVQEANAAPGPDVIVLPAGVHALTIAGTGEDEAATGDLDVTGDLTIQGGPGSIIDGGGLDRIIDVGATTLRLSDVVLTNGSSEHDGGALRGFHSTVELTDVDVTTSLAAGDGGAIYLGGGTLTVTGSTFVGNGAVAGGAIFLDAAGASISSSVFAGNVAAEGGALAAMNVPFLSIDGCEFSGNVASSRGGAISLAGVGAPEVVLAVSATSFTENVAIAGMGGAIFIDDLAPTGLGAPGAVVVDSSSFALNSARGGGAIWSDDDPLTIIDSAFDTNSATEGIGGAVYAYAPVTVTDSTFTGNWAWEGGPALWAADAASLDGLTLSGNFSHEGIFGDVVVYDGLSEESRTFIEENRGYTGEPPTSAPTTAAPPTTVTTTTVSPTTTTGGSPTSTTGVPSTGPTDTDPGPTTHDGELPRTGTGGMTVVAWAALVMAGGAIVAVTGRRPRSTRR